MLVFGFHFYERGIVGVFMIEKCFDFEQIKNGYEHYKKTKDLSFLENIARAAQQETPYISREQKLSCSFIIDKQYYALISKTDQQFFKRAKREVEKSASRNFGIVLNSAEYGFLYGLRFLGQKILIKRNEPKVAFLGYYESIPIMCCVVMELLERILKQENKQL